MLRTTSLRAAVAVFALTAFAPLARAEPPFFPGRPEGTFEIPKPFPSPDSPDLSPFLPKTAADKARDEVMSDLLLPCQIGRPEAERLLAPRRAERLLLDRHLRATGCKVTEAEVDELMDKLRDIATNAGPRFKGMLGDEAEVRKIATAELRWARYAEAKATDAELRKLFKENRELFDGSRVRARHILIASPSKDPRDVKKAANRLRAIRAAIQTEVNDGLAALPAEAGADALEKERVRLLTEAFARHAREKSDCPSKSQGGELGSFPRAFGMEAAFADAAFALKPFQMSDVVPTKHGQHLILVTDHKPGRDVSFAAVNKDVVRVVYWDRLRARLLAQLRSKGSGEGKPGE